MPSSQNGWNANDRSAIQSREIPGGRIAVRRGTAGDILVYVATRFHNEVEQLVWPGNWGYAERPIRGGSQLSNHASGTAIDLNAPKHPLGVAPGRTFTQAQMSKVREILVFLEGAVRWGGDYIGRKDAMHFEINTNQANCDRVWRKISGSPAPPSNFARDLERGMKGEDVRRLQERLNEVLSWYPDMVVDSDYGPTTEKAVKEFQKRNGLGQDGIVGPRTRAKLSI